MVGESSHVRHRLEVGADPARLGTRFGGGGGTHLLGVATRMSPPYQPTA